MKNSGRWSMIISYQEELIAMSTSILRRIIGIGEAYTQFRIITIGEMKNNNECSEIWMNVGGI